jgi:hypothetical protein
MHRVSQRSAAEEHEVPGLEIGLTADDLSTGRRFLACLVREMNLSVCPLVDGIQSQATAIEALD